MRDESRRLGSPATCDVCSSSGFYRSTEFTERGYFIFRFYNAVLGRLPLYTEFMSDLSSLSDSQSPVEQQRRIATFIAGFMGRDEFVTKYPGLATSANAAQFVARLEGLAQVSLPETIPPQRPDQPPQFTRSQLIQMMGSGQKTGAETLRALSNSRRSMKVLLSVARSNAILGYLRRGPEQGAHDWVRVYEWGRADRHQPRLPDLISAHYATNTERDRTVKFAMKVFQGRTAVRDTNK